jgi:DNA-binding CsgD family transcriptional regulator
MAKRKSKPRGGQVKRTPAQTQLKSARALTAMRSEGISLSRAAREQGISPSTVKRHAKSALRKTRGRYKARASDRMLRVLVLPTSDGLAEIASRDSRSATIAGEYWNAVQTFLQTGDDTELRRFRGVSIVDADGKAVPLLADLDELERLGAAGVLSFESLYARVA